MSNFFLDLFFPKKCLGCGEWGDYLCANFFNFIKTIDRPICPLCHRPSIGGMSHPRCQQPWGLDGLTSVFSYQGIIKKAIIKLKYKFVTDLAETILELFLSFIGEDKVFTDFLQDKIFLVPVPLHWTRENWRGFNQAELLGKMISQKLEIIILPDLLVRKRFTQPQSKLKKKARQENIKGAFGFNKKKFPNIFLSQHPSILLFDDVWTTGATMKNCAQVLKKNGAKKVWGLTLAR